MSRSLRKPSVTPLTALATRLRARPWNLPSSGSSRSVLACSWSPASSKPMPGGSGWSSLPFGPCTSTAPGLTSIFTPLGTAMIFLPILDMMEFPDVAEDFAADARLDRFAAGHDAARRGQDARAEAGEDVRDVVTTEVDAASRAADALDAGDDLLAARPVLQDHAQDALRLAVLRLDHLVALNVAFALQDLRNLHLQARQRHIDARMPRLGRVADSGEHVCDRVSHISVSSCHLPDAGSRLPATLGHACDVPLQRELAEAEAAQRELEQVGARAAAAAAAVAQPDLDLRRLRFLGDL